MQIDRLFSSIQLRLQENLAISDTYNMVEPTMRQPLSAAGYLFSASSTGVLKSVAKIRKAAFGREADDDRNDRFVLQRVEIGRWCSTSASEPTRTFARSGA
jgi:hypothetical protein